MNKVTINNNLNSSKILITLAGVYIYTDILANPKNIIEININRINLFYAV